MYHHVSRQVWLLGDVYPLAVSNQITFLAEKDKIGKWRGQLMGNQWHVSCRWVGGLRSSSDDDETKNLFTKNNGLPRYGRGSGQDSSARYIRTYSTNLFSSAEMRISCISHWAKTTSSQRANFDANQGKFITNYCGFHSPFWVNLQHVNHKVLNETHLLLIPWASSGDRDRVNCMSGSFRGKKSLGCGGIAQKRSAQAAWRKDFDGKVITRVSAETYDGNKLLFSLYSYAEESFATVSVFSLFSTF